MANYKILVDNSNIWQYSVHDMKYADCTGNAENGFRIIQVNSRG